MLWGIASSLSMVDAGEEESMTEPALIRLPAACSMVRRENLWSPRSRGSPGAVVESVCLRAR